MALDVLGLGLANSYTDETVEGGGAIKGKNCTVDDISKSGKKNTVRFKWTLDDGTVLTGNMEVLDGEDGSPGADGDPGPAGKGIASIAQVTGESKIVITYDDGTTSDLIDIPTVAGQDGKDGKDGTDGTNGTDGVSPTVTVKTSTSDTYVLTITDASGSLDTPNLKGADGQDGAPGTDGQDGQDGVGVPVGGTTGQVLKKKSGTDYDTEWANESGGGGGLPSGGTTGQVLAKKTNDDYDTEWVNVGNTYSTTEQVIGTWIDGKILYQRTITLRTPNTTSETNVWSGITGLETVFIDFNASFMYHYASGTNTHQYIPLCEPWSTGDLGAIPLMGANLSGHPGEFGVAFKVTLGEWCNKDATITIRYTKAD